MRFKKPYVAALDQVKIGRQGEYGIMERPLHFPSRGSVVFAGRGAEAQAQALVTLMLQQTPPVNSEEADQHPFRNVDTAVLSSEWAQPVAQRVVFLRKLGNIGGNQ